MHLNHHCELKMHIIELHGLIKGKVAISHYYCPLPVHHYETTGALKYSLA